jgi:small-conductance mechanosensitive channel
LRGKGKAVAAVGVLLAMATFLAVYRTYVCSIETPDEVQLVDSAIESTVLTPTDPEPEQAQATPEDQQMHQALTEQTIILQEISQDMDEVNQSLDEITVLLQEERR